MIDEVVNLRHLLRDAACRELRLRLDKQELEVSGSKRRKLDSDCGEHRGCTCINVGNVHDAWLSVSVQTPNNQKNQYEIHDRFT